MTGRKGDFLDLYTSKEIKSMNTYAASSARFKFGASDDAQFVMGLTKEHIASSYNVPLERIMEAGCSYEFGGCAFSIKPLEEK